MEGCKEGHPYSSSSFQIIGGRNESSILESLKNTCKLESLFQVIPPLEILILTDLSRVKPLQETIMTSDMETWGNSLPMGMLRINPMCPYQLRHVGLQAAHSNTAPLPLSTVGPGAAFLWSLPVCYLLSKGPYCSISLTSPLPFSRPVPLYFDLFKRSLF